MRFCLPRVIFWGDMPAEMSNVWMWYAEWIRFGAGGACFDWLEGCELLNGAKEVDGADDAWLVAGTIDEEEEEESE